MVWFLSSSRGDVCLSLGLGWRPEALWSLEVLWVGTQRRQHPDFSLILCAVVLERWKVEITAWVVF